MNKIKLPVELEPFRFEFEFVAERWGTFTVLDTFSGFSGAAVAAVLFKGDDPDSVSISKGRYMLKLIKGIKESDQMRNNRSNEDEAHQRACKFHPEFASCHIADLVHSDVIDNPDQGAPSSVLLYQVAGGKMDNIVRLDESKHRQSRKVVESVVSTLQDCWCSGKISDSEWPAGSIVAAWLHGRMKGNRGQELTALAKEEFKDEWATPGGRLVNPLWLLNESEFMLDQGASFHCLMGLMHGDLHAGNILTHYRDPRNSPFWLIDFAKSEADVPYGYDHAYLELSLLINHIRGGLNPLLSVLDALYSDHADKVSNFNEWLLDLLKDVHRVEHQWAQNVIVGLSDHVERQFVLARIAAGLNWASKSWPDPEQQRLRRRLAMFYAAWWSRHYLENHFPQSYDRLLGGTRELSHSVPDKSRKEISQNSKDATWDVVWSDINSEVNRFDGASQKLMLVSDALANGNARSLGCLPWSAVIDLDPISDTDGLYRAAHPVLEKNRALHVCGLELDVADFRRGTLWMMAAGWLSKAEEPPTFNTWRYDYRPKIETLIRRFHEATSLEPVRIVMLVPAGGDTEEFRQRQDIIVDIIDMVYRGDESLVRILQIGSGKTISHPLVQHFPIPVDEFIIRLSEVHGVEELSDAPQIPASDGKKATLPLHTLRLIEEDLDVLHTRILQDNQGEETGEPFGESSAFWKGHSPTWHDIHQGQDVLRPKYQKRIINAVSSALREGRNCRVELRHMPGTGGTTLAMRVAWEMRGSHPVAMLREYHSRRTVEHVDRLFRVALNRPVMLVAESSVIGSDELDSLIRELSIRNCRVVVLLVRRILPGTTSWDSAEESEHDVEGSLDEFVDDPDELNTAAVSFIELGKHMSHKEACEFRDVYAKLIEQDPNEQQRDQRRRELDRITDLRGMLRYRVPFFYGLIAFERDFRPIREYVAAHFSGRRGIDPTIRQMMSFLALATRFCNYGIPRPVLDRLLQLKIGNQCSLSDLLGDGPSGLAIQNGQSVSLMHPIIAEEVLQHSLGSGAQRNEWKTIVGRQAIQLIDLLHGCDLTENKDVRELLASLFIKRELELQASTDDEEIHPELQPFAELVMTADEFDEEESQKGREILDRLTEICDDDAHFFLHLGRYLEKRDGNYEKAIRCLDKSLHLDGSSHIHWHQRGYIYWQWIRATTRRVEFASADEMLGDIADRFERATLDFEKARAISPYDDAGFTTNIRMITQIAEQIRVTTGSATVWEAARMSRQVQRWCDEWLCEALSLFDRVKLLYSREELDTNEHIQRCLHAIDRLYGSPDQADQLIVESEMRRIGGANNSFANRHLARLYFRSSHDASKTLDPSVLRRIKTLMEENLKTGPTKPDDFQLWFESYRHLEEFDSDEAISRLSGWTRRDGEEFKSTEGMAYYYLAAMHFVRWFNGAENNPRKFCRFLQLSKDNRSGSRGRSPEWLSRTDLLGITSGNVTPQYTLVSEYDLGEWDRSRTPRFWKQTDLLVRINGTIQQIDGMQRGYIKVQHDDVLAYFVPGKEFYEAEHRNADVNFYLSFRFDEVTAWSVRLGTVDDGDAVTPNQRRREALASKFSRPIGGQAEVTTVDVEKLHSDHRKREHKRAAEYVIDIVSARENTSGILLLSDLDSILPALMKRDRLYAALGFDGIREFVESIKGLRVIQSSGGWFVSGNNDTATRPTSSKDKNRRRGKVSAMYVDYGFVLELGVSGGRANGMPPEERWFHESSCDPDQWSQLRRGTLIEFSPSEGPDGSPRAEDIVQVAGIETPCGAEFDEDDEFDEIGTIADIKQKKGPESYEFGFITTGNSRNVYFKSAWFPLEQRSQVKKGSNVRFTPKRLEDGKVCANNPRLVARTTSLGLDDGRSTFDSAKDSPGSSNEIHAGDADAARAFILESLAERGEITLADMGNLLIDEFGKTRATAIKAAGLKAFLTKTCGLTVITVNGRDYVKFQPKTNKTRQTNSKDVARGVVCTLKSNDLGKFGFIKSDSLPDAFFRLSWFPKSQQANVTRGCHVEFLPKDRRGDGIDATDPRLVVSTVTEPRVPVRESSSDAYKDIIGRIHYAVLKVVNDHGGRRLLSDVGHDIRKLFDPNELEGVKIKPLGMFLKSRGLLTVTEVDQIQWVEAASGPNDEGRSRPVASKSSVQDQRSKQKGIRGSVSAEDIHQWVLFHLRENGNKILLPELGNRIREAFDQRQLEGIHIQPLRKFLESSGYFVVELIDRSCWVSESKPGELERVEDFGDPRAPSYGNRFKQ